MTTHPIHRAATYEDLEKVPDRFVAELIDGELHVSPRPASPHALAAARLSRRLGAFDDGDGGEPGGWWILIEPELHLRGRELAMVPDLAGWRRERMPEFPDVAAFELAPDWVCEIVSPHTGRLDRVKKLPKYARAGVQHAWLLDPLQRILEVYRVANDSWLQVAVYGGDGDVRAEPFDAIELPLRTLWTSPTPPDPEP